MATDFEKDPDAVLDYHFDWTEWMANGDYIVGSLFIATPGIVIGNGSNGAANTAFTTTNTTVWLLGGSPGQPYVITNRITTAQGRIDDRSMTIRVADR